MDNRRAVYSGRSRPGRDRYRCRRLKLVGKNVACLNRNAAQSTVIDFRRRWQELDSDSYSAAMAAGELKLCSADTFEYDRTSTPTYFYIRILFFCYINER